MISYPITSKFSKKISSAEAIAQKCSIKKGVLKNFAKFTGGHLSQNPSFKKVADLYNFNRKMTEAQVNFAKLLRCTFGGCFCLGPCFQLYNIPSCTMNLVSFFH